MTPRKLDILVATFPYGGNGAAACEHPDIRNYLLKACPQASADERVGRVRVRDWNDTPITMTRNAAVKYAKDNGFDVILMIDSDQAPDNMLGEDPDAKPFWDEAFTFIYDNYSKGPHVVGAPYVGGPPYENVMVFRWRSFESGHPNLDHKLDGYTREESANLSGVQECAALPTGLIMFDTRAFDLTGPKQKDIADRIAVPLIKAFEGDKEKLTEGEIRALVNNVVTENEKNEHAWFYYEYKDRFQTEKGSTEDVTATRDISLYGLATLGYNPIHCAWSSWAGHWKPKCSSKPTMLTASDVNERYVRAARDGTDGDFKTIEANFEIANV